MTDWQTGRLIYLVLLLTVLIFWFFVQGRGEWSKKLQHMAAWVLIFLGTIAAIGLWGDIRQTVTPRQSVFDDSRVELPRAPDGHYYVTLHINEVPVIFVVDTGASGMVLSADDARSVGIDTDSLAFHGQANTANGMVQTAPVRLDTVSLGPIMDRDVRAYVNGGQMTGSLLGMTYLQKFEKVEISGGKMVLTR